MVARVKSGQRREQVVDAALGQLAATGYDGTTMVSIAAELGIDRVIIYRQFADFDEVFRAVVGHVRRMIDDAVDEAIRLAINEPDAETRSKIFLASLLGAARSRPEVWRFLRNTPSRGDVRAQVTALNDELAARIIGQLIIHGTERRPTLTRRELTWGVAFLYNGVFGALAAHLDHEPERTDAEFVVFLSRMVRRIVA